MKKWLVVQKSLLVENYFVQNRPVLKISTLFLVQTENENINLIIYCAVFILNCIFAYYAFTYDKNY